MGGLYVDCYLANDSLHGKIKKVAKWQANHFYEMC